MKATGLCLAVACGVFLAALIAMLAQSLLYPSRQGGAYDDPQRQLPPVSTPLVQCVDLGDTYVCTLSSRCEVKDLYVTCDKRGWREKTKR